MKPLETGNIDLSKRPKIKNKDGSYSTLSSSSYNIDGVEVLLPTISPQGKRWTDEEAIQNYRNTGQHLGKFATPEEATQYAKQLHNQQQKDYRLKPFTELYRKWDEPSFNPAMTQLKPKAVKDTSNRNVLSRLYETVLDSFNDARQKLLREKTGQPNDNPIEVIGGRG